MNYVRKGFLVTFLHPRKHTIIINNKNKSEQLHCVFSLFFIQRISIKKLLIFRIPQSFPHFPSEMLRRVLFGSSAGAAAVAGLRFELVKEPKSLEPLVASVLRETEKRQGLTNIPPYNKRDFAYAAKTKDGQLAGGILGYTNYNELHIAMLAINPDCAVRGAGTTLLKGVEEAARSTYACNRMALETFDWQARPFYEKYGFEVFGIHKGQPKGHEKFFMEKIWSPEENKVAPTCYTRASADLEMEEWNFEVATKQLGEWLDGDTQRRNIPGVPPYDMTPFGLQVTDADGAVVAYCLYETWWDELHVDKIAVVPDRQRQGIGSAVLKKVEEIAREKKLPHLVADAMSWQAHPFYEKHGFEVFATQKNVPPGHSHLRLLRVLQ